MTSHCKTLMGSSQVINLQQLPKLEITLHLFSSDVLITTQAISNWWKLQKILEDDFYLGFTNYILKRWICDSFFNLLSTRQDAMSSKTRNAQVYSQLFGSALPLCFHQVLFHLITVESWYFAGVRTCFSYQCPKELFFNDRFYICWHLCQATAHFQNFPSLNPAFLLIFKKENEMLLESWRILFS